MRIFLAALAACVLLCAPAWAQTEVPGAAALQPPQILDLKFEVQDLVFPVEDVGGQVQDLQVKESDTEITIDLAADVLFDFDKANIKPAAAQALHQAASVIREKAKGTVRINGYTDAKGSDAYNLRLSDRRARAVKTWLVTREGLRGVTFVTHGYGEANPVAPNAKPDGSDDPEGRQKNRRVEIILKKKS
jgi:outer membrane protein OmpA-like peptidoglycan-associated protein